MDDAHSRETLFFKEKKRVKKKKEELECWRGWGDEEEEVEERCINFTYTRRRTK